MKKKNSIVLQKKVNLRNKYFKNTKIKKIYKVFRKNFYSQIDNNRFCIGVSGGPDSLALAFLCKSFSEEFNSKFLALIVNHNLRKGSENEAIKVKKILVKHKINAKILNWRGAIPKSNIQFYARNLRYSLLEKGCKKFKTNNLVLAHHEGDLIENFFIRMFRGSGLKGLSSFNVKSYSIGNSLNLIRPLPGKFIIFLVPKRKILEMWQDLRLARQVILHNFPGFQLCQMRMGCRLLAMIVRMVVLGIYELSN